MLVLKPASCRIHILLRHKPATDIERITMRNLQIPETAKSRIVFKWLFHPAFQIKTDLPPAAQILCWLLQTLQRHENNKLLQGGGFFGVAGGN